MTDSTSIMPRWLGRCVSAALMLVVLGCSRTPAEPDAPPSPALAAPAVAPLTWDVPGTWTSIPAQRSGPKKATYKVSHVGNDKEDAEVTVLFYGTGNLGDVSKNFDSWFGEFDGDAGAAAKRESFTAESTHFKVEMVDTSGTYKVALAPPMGPSKKAPVQMVKQSYRMLGAAVETPDRGNWFFKLTGPDETVQAARDAFRATLQSAR